MTTKLRPAVLATLLFYAIRAVGSPSPPHEAAKADCSFSNPRLPGRCNVTIPVPRHSNPQQACEAVLRCINSGACPDSQKYCTNPGLARDWNLEEAHASRPRVDCAYANPNYSGWCRMSAPVPEGATPQQACEAVLPCLNGSPCDGFTLFCDPDNRSGWTLAEVKGPPPRPTPKH